MNRQDGHSWRDYLAHWSPKYLSHDPHAIPALTLAPPAGSPGLVMIRDQTLILPETGIFALSQYDLAGLAQAIAATGWGATVNPGLPGTLSATALLDTGESSGSPVALQNAYQFPTLGVAGTATYALLRPLAQQWDARWHDIALFALGELEGPWLDAFGTYLQIPRIGGEPDTLYSTRLYGLAITGSPNNVSMETFFAALGYSVSMVDTAPAQFTAIFQWPTQPPAGFVYSPAQLAGMIDVLKAVGVLATTILQSQLTDSLSVTDDGLSVYATVDNPTVWGGSLGLSPGVVGVVGPPADLFVAALPALPPDTLTVPYVYAYSMTALWPMYWPDTTTTP